MKLKKNDDIKMKNVNSMKNEKFNSKSKNNQFVDETFLILKILLLFR